MNININGIIEITKKALQKSYAPYSNYHVGASLITKTGKIYTGCNIENQGIMSICAERVAFTKAISEGEKEFESIYVCGGRDINNLDDCLPCGYCRQFMSEFVEKDFTIHVIGKDNKITSYKIKDLLPCSFKF